MAYSSDNLRCIFTAHSVTFKRFSKRAGDSYAGSPFGYVMMKSTNCKLSLLKGELSSMKNALLKLVVCGLFITGVAFAMHIRTANTFLLDNNITGVSLLYNDIEGPTSGACPQIENGQSAMDDVFSFLHTLNIRWYGFTGNQMDIPCYSLYFYDEDGMPQVKMYITSTGYLYCGQLSYRIISPSVENAWLQLNNLYEKAINLQENKKS